MQLKVKGLFKKKKEKKKKKKKKEKEKGREWLRKRSTKRHLSHVRDRGRFREGQIDFNS
jgi:hypothetical protein